MGESLKRDKDKSAEELKQEKYCKKGLYPLRRTGKDTVLKRLKVVMLSSARLSGELPE